MKKKLFNLLIVVPLLLAMACSPAVLTTIVGYVNQFLPVAEVIANLIIATEAPNVADQAQAVEAKVNFDVQQIEAIAATITNQNYSDKRAAIMALADDAKAQLGTILTIGGIKNPATVTKIKAYVALADAVIDQIIQALPAKNVSAAQAMVAPVKIGNVMHNYKHEFNKITEQKTGDTKVDGVLAKTPKFFVLGWSGYRPTFR